MGKRIKNPSALVTALGVVALGVGGYFVYDALAEAKPKKKKKKKKKEEKKPAPDDGEVQTDEDEKPEPQPEPKPEPELETLYPGVHPVYFDDQYILKLPRVPKAVTQKSVGGKKGATHLSFTFHGYDDPTKLGLWVDKAPVNDTEIMDITVWDDHYSQAPGNKIAEYRFIVSG